MTDLRKAAEMALEALESFCGRGYSALALSKRCDAAIKELRQALAEPANSTTNLVEPKAASQTEQEPWVKTYCGGKPNYCTPVDETAKREHEPVWSTEECDRVMKTLRYIQGIAERGEGRAMRDDETLEQFVLGYVKKLERPEQEPVAWVYKGNFHPFDPSDWAKGETATPLYTAPPKREWVGLTESEIVELAGGGITRDERMIARAIEAKLKEKNA